MKAPSNLATGTCRTCTGMVKIAITLDEDTFAEVRVGAAQNDCSFAAQARMLIEVGLETLKEPVE